MGITQLRRPPAPSAAERARSVIARANTPAPDPTRGADAGAPGSLRRGGTASVVGTGCPPSTPVTHHVWADGSAALLLADDDPLLTHEIDGGPRLHGDSDAGAMLELRDRAPVDLREPVRALLWITGRLTVPDPGPARRIATAIADAHPDPALLDLGHGTTLVRLAPGSVVLSDAEGTAALTPLALAAARPDPFCHYEQRWLAHLEASHPDVLGALAHHLPHALRGAAVRPLGVDRCGLRLRIETGHRDHDVRLRWEHDITTVEELRAQFQLLVGCPYRRATERR